MSALAQSPNLFRALRRRINEPEAILTISNAALTATDAVSGLESMASAALRLNGVQEVQVWLLKGGGEMDLLQWRHSKVSSARGAATGLITANSREWGKLRLLFEPRIESVECPLRFTRILAQQAGLMLNRLELIGRNQIANAAVRRLRERLDARKAVSRAAGILAQAKQLTYERAILLLLKQARERRRSPLQLANTIILGEETVHLPFVPFRRLRSDEPTSARGVNFN